MTSINKISKSLTTILSNLNKFQLAEAVNRVSEKQLQVREIKHLGCQRIKTNNVLSCAVVTAVVIGMLRLRYMPIID